VTGELFKMMAGVDMVHVPYRSAGPALTDLLGGQVQVMFASTVSSIEYVRAGRLHALAVTTATRSEVLGPRAWSKPDGQRIFAARHAQNPSRFKPMVFASGETCPRRKIAPRAVSTAGVRGRVRVRGSPASGPGPRLRSVHTQGERWARSTGALEFSDLILPKRGLFPPRNHVIGFIAALALVSALVEIDENQRRYGQRKAHCLATCRADGSTTMGGGWIGFLGVRHSVRAQAKSHPHQ
jgi:Tripartite tricarboxylate transporter family receptor